MFGRQRRRGSFGDAEIENVRPPSRQAFKTASNFCRRARWTDQLAIGIPYRKVADHRARSTNRFAAQQSYAICSTVLIQSQPERSRIEFRISSAGFDRR